MLRALAYGLLWSWPVAACLGLACWVVWSARPMHPADPVLVGLALLVGLMIGCHTILHAWGEEVSRQGKDHP